MLREEIRNIRSERRDLRNFGLTVGIALSAFGGVFMWAGKGFYLYFLFAGAAFIFFGLSAPSLLKPLQRPWMVLSLLLGWFMTRLILGVLFYAVLAPMGFVLRAFGKRFLELEIEKERKSYWNYRSGEKAKREDYERQF